MSALPLTIDCHYIKPNVAAAYLVVEGDRALFVENNTTHAVPHLLSALEATGLAPEQVEYAIITHVHLDHAGGSSALMEACPGATLLAHPRAARHVIDPSRLIASSIGVYGEENFRKLYGEIKPVSADRVRTMADGERLEFGSRTLEFFDTRGHANHHFCIFDSSTNGVFTGDSFGIAYPALQTKGPFIFASTTPTDFEPDEARASIDRIVATGAERIYPTHFDVFEHVQAGADQLKVDIDESERIRDRIVSDYAPEEAQADEFAREALRSHFAGRLERAELDGSLLKELELDIEINAQGLVFAARRLQKKRKEHGGGR